MKFPLNSTMADATDTSERGLERLICTAMAGHPCDPRKEGRAAEAPAGYGGVGWIGANPHDYDREYCVDRGQLAAFLRGYAAGGRRIAGPGRGRTDAAQVPGAAAGRDLQARHHRRAATRREARRAQPGTVLRHAVGREPAGTGALPAEPLHRHPTASLQPATTTRRALDIGLFINGLPIFTFELKNSLTKQTACMTRFCSTGGTVTRARSCSNSAAVSPTSPWTRTRCAFALISKGTGVLVPAIQPGLERRSR